MDQTLEICQQQKADARSVIRETCELLKKGGKSFHTHWQKITYTIDIIVFIDKAILLDYTLLKLSGPKKFFASSPEAYGAASQNHKFWQYFDMAKKNIINGDSKSQ
jgi:hypothetical protein